MTDRRSQMVEAALGLLADGGTKALTHRGVDRALGLPLGSTGNYFPTRTSLVDAILEHLSALEVEAYSSGEPTPDAEDPAGAARRLAHYAQATTEGPLAVETKARLALAIGGSDTRSRHESHSADLLAMIEGFGVDEPGRRARAVSAYIDGIVLHALTVGVPVDVDEATVVMTDLMTT